MNRMLDKYCVVTGGNSGIGAATAKLFLDEGAAGVAILDIEVPGKDFYAYAKELGDKAIAIPCNVMDSAIVDDAFTKVHEKFGRIDVLVCCAGVLDENAPVEKTEDWLYDRTVGINQNGVFYCCRAALRYMTEQKKGSIVNVSSVAGVSGNSGVSYSMSKHAVMSISRNIAIQYCDKDIRCNTILPGPTRTPMNVPPQPGQEMPPYFDLDFIQKCQTHTDITVPWCDAIDQARAILFFASDEARYITGQWIQVDHGFY